MAVRIRYCKYSDTSLNTKQTYIIPTGQVVYGVIDYADVFVVRIKEVDRDVVHYETRTDTLKDAKKAVKDALASLGVVFNTELRAKKNQAELDAVEQQIVDDLKDTL